MTWKNILFLACVTLFTTQLTFAQEGEMLSQLPDKNKESFIDSEPELFNTIAYLERTTLLEQEAKRKKQQALLMGWLENSPTVTVELHAYVLPLSAKNKDFLLTYLGGWAKYSIENEYSKDKVKCGVAGVQSVLKYYSNNIENKASGVVKNKDIEKLILLDQKGELEAWVKAQVK